MTNRLTVNKDKYRHDRVNLLTQQLPVDILTLQLLVDILTFQLPVNILKLQLPINILTLQLPSNYSIQVTVINDKYRHDSINLFTQQLLVNILHTSVTDKYTDTSVTVK